MTIESLSSYLSKNVSGHKIPIQLDKLAGYCLAIDMGYLCFQMKSTALKDVLNRYNFVQGPFSSEGEKEADQLALRMILERLILFLNHKIQIFCCFEGTSHPLRQYVRERRSSDRAKAQAKIRELEAKLSSTPPLFRNALKEEMTKAYKNCVSVGYSLTEKVRSMVKALGLAQASTDDFPPPEHLTHFLASDGEALAATLILNNICHYAYTTDYDAHVYGCENVIHQNNDYRNQDRQTTFENDLLIRNSLTILHGCQLSFQQFRMATILACNDYNEKIDGFAFGKSSKLVREATTPENVHFIAILCACYQTMFRLHSSGQVVDQIPFRNLLIQTGLSPEDLQGLFNFFSLPSDPVSLSASLSTFGSYLSAFHSQELMVKLFHPAINWSQVYPLITSSFRSLPPNLTCQIQAEKFRQEGKQFLEENGLSDLSLMFTRFLPTNS